MWGIVISTNVLAIVSLCYICKHVYSAKLHRYFITHMKIFYNNIRTNITKKFNFINGHAEQVSKLIEQD